MKRNLLTITMVTLLATLIYSGPGAAFGPVGGGKSAVPQHGGTAGKVLEVMDAGGYTYLLFESKEGKRWVATSLTKLKPGDEVVVPDGLVMKNFQSKALNRTFEEIYFVGAVGTGADTSQKMAAPPTKTTETSLKKIQRIKGGQTVSEIYEGKDKLGGREVNVRGQVTKFSAGIMGKNWIHLQDGTGKPGTNDLTVTTKDVAAVGDIITAKGLLSVDKDFGYGYKFSVILEDAGITRE